MVQKGEWDGNVHIQAEQIPASSTFLRSWSAAVDAYVLPFEIGNRIFIFLSDVDKK